MSLVCATMLRDEPLENVLEWIHWHFYIGFDALVILDHHSREPLSLGIPGVRILDTAFIPENQRYHYVIAKHCYYNRLVDDFCDADWLAFIDIDEFILFEPGLTLMSALAALGSVDAVALYWRMFGPDGYDCTPPGPTFGNYTRAVFNPVAFKTLVRPGAVLEKAELPLRHNSHQPVLKQGRTQVNTRGEVFPRDFLKNIQSARVSPDKRELRQLRALASHGRIWINHYHIKSRQDYERKKNLAAEADEVFGYYQDPAYFLKWKHHRGRVEDFTALSYLRGFDEYLKSCGYSAGFRIAEEC